MKYPKRRQDATATKYQQVLAMTPSFEPTTGGGSACPSRDDLEGLLNGGTTAINWEHLSTHLEVCADCESMLDAISEVSDVGVQLLSMLPPGNDDEPEFRDLHAQLMAAPLTFSGDETMDELAGEPFEEDPFATRTLPIDVGRYRLLEPIGSGATGTVYRARHLELDREVAIKILSWRRSHDPESVERFRQEIRAIGQLKHPNIVDATDAGHVDGHHYLVMEFAEGANLSTLLQAHGPLEIADACEVIRQTALGLAYAHEQNMVHRDVKLSNLLLTNEAVVKLLDLGLVAVKSNLGESRETNQRRQGQGPRGTADYMSPEQWTDYEAVDHRSDLYSLGCTLFKLLTGTAPFSRLPEGCPSKRHAHLDYTAPSLSTLRRDAPAQLVDTVDRLLAKAPDQRIPSAAEVAERMNRILQLAPSAGAADLAGLINEPTASRAKRSKRKRTTFREPIYQRRKFLAGAAAAIMGGALARWTFRSPAPPQPYKDGVWRPLSPTEPVFLPREVSQTANVVTASEPKTLTNSFSRESPITIDEKQTVLMHFGQPTRGTFSLAAEFEQASWQSEAGIFFGYRSTASGVTYDSIQFVDKPSSSTASKPARRIVWAKHGFGLKDGVPFATDEPLAEATIAANGTNPVTMEVSLGAFAMPKLSYQGQPISDADWQLSFEGRERLGLAANKRNTNYLGRLGVLCGPAPTTIHNVRLKYHATQE